MNRIFTYLFLATVCLVGFLDTGHLKAQNKNASPNAAVFPIQAPNNSTHIKQTHSPGLTGMKGASTGTGISSFSNETCATALNIPLNTLISDNASSLNTQEVLGPILCNGFTSSTAKDVWYKFTKTAAMDTLYVTPISSTDDPVVEIFSGTCSAITSIGCSDLGGGGVREGFIITSLPVGTTFFFRVYGWAGVTANYTLLIKSVAAPATPPPNDACAAAQALVTNVPASGYNSQATQSTAPVLCSGSTSTNANDVWYSFVKTAGMDSIVLTPTTADLVLEVRSNSCPGTSIFCSDLGANAGVERINISGLTNGTTYLVRVYGWSTQTGTFTLEVKSPPANNDCTGALQLTGSLNCSSASSGTTVGANLSLAPIVCSAFTGTSDDDVWYSFVKTAASDSIIVTPVGTFDPVVDLRSATCTTGTSLDCSDDATNGTAIERIYVGGLVNGTTYYVRIYSFGSGSAAEGTFTICLKTKAIVAPPANDACASSVFVPAGVLTSGTSVGATQILAPITCGVFTSSAALDVWYRFTKSALTDTLIITPSDFDPVVDVRTNNCTTGTNVACADLAGIVAEKIPLGALVDGTTYLFRVYGWAGATGNFTILLKDAGAVAAPANDNCLNATPLPINTDCQYFAGTNVGSTAVLAAAACSGTLAGVANDVWYTFVANGDKAIINLESAIGFDGAVALYSGACANPTEIGCADIYGGATVSTETIYATGLINGQTYRIRVYGYQGAEGTFSICVYNPGCTSTIGTLTANVSTVISNQAFTVAVTGAIGAIGYEYSSDQVNWIPYAGLDDAADTMVFSGTINGTLYLRAVGQTGLCFPAYSPIVQMPFRCATPFSNSLATTNDFIKQVQLNTINQLSAENLFGGNVQDFTGVSTTLCRSTSYPMTIATNYSAVQYNRMVWIDFNQDGDFADPGENVHFGPFVTSATNPVINITIPASATLGNTRMRVAIINNVTSITSSDPCAAGPYSLGEIEEYTVNISAGVQALAGNDQVICSTSTTLAANNPGVGNTGTWSVVSGAGTFAQPNQFNSTVSGLAAGQNVLRWTIVSACGTTNAVITVTVNPLSATAGPDITICSGLGNLTATVPSNGNGSWSLLAGAGTITTPNLPNSTVTAIGIGVNQFLWTVSSAGCVSKTDTLTITRLQDPSDANAGTDQSQCSGTGTLNAAPPQIGVGQWTVLQGNGIVSNPGLANSGVTGMNNGLNRFRWTVSNGTCQPKTDDVTIAVTEPPNAQAGLDQNICIATTQVTGNAPNNSTYQWNLISGSGSIANATSSTTAISNLGVGQNVFSYTVTRPGCPIDMDTVIITRKAVPTAFAGTDQTICTNSATLTASVPSDGTGQWSLISGSGQIATAGNATTQVTGLAVGDNVFRWTVTNAPCQPVTDDVTITTTGNAVAANAGNDATICAANYTVVGNSPGTGTGTWTLISGLGTIASPNTASTQISGLGVGINVFRWTITNGVCPASSDEVLITRTPATTISAAGPDQTLCSTTATLAANTPGQGTGVWTLVGGSGTFANPFSPTTTVTGLGTGSNTFRWNISNPPCQASLDDVVITTTATATTANAGVDQVLCSDVVTLAGNAATQGTGQWTVVSGSGTFASSTSATTQVTGVGVGDNVYRWTITNGACAPSVDDVSITRKAEAATPTAGPDQNICTSSATLAATSPTVGIGTWTLISGTGTIINPNSPTSQVTGLGAGANVLRFTVTNAPCQPVSDEVTINTTLAATTALAGADQTICGNSTSLSANNPQTGIGLWTVVSGAGSFSNAGSPNTIVSGLGNGTNVFQWTISSGGVCAPSSDNVSIIVQSAPSQANAGNDQTLCGTSATLAANQPTTGSGKWTLVSGSGQFINDTDAGTQVINLGNGANTFRWTINNLPCAATQDEVVINSTPANVTADAGPDKTVCGSTANLTATSPTAGTGTWSVISGTGQISQAGQAVTGVFGLGTGANQFLWTVVNGSCTATDVVTINREANPVHLGPDTLFCVETNPTYTLTGPQGMTGYLWSTGSLANQITVSQTSQYILGVVTPNQCPFSDTVNVAFSICTDVAGEVSRPTPSFVIVPNPSTSAAHLFTQLPEQEGITAEIWDLKGVKIRPSINQTSVGKSTIALPNDMAAGTYLLKIKGQSFVKTLKWVVE